MKLFRRENSKGTIYAKGVTPTTPPIPAPRWVESDNRRPVRQNICAACGARLGWWQPRDSRESTIPLVFCDDCHEDRKTFHREVW